MERRKVGFVRNLWGGAVHLLERKAFFKFADILALVVLGGVIYGVMSLARDATGIMRPTVVIDLSPWALPKYTLLSLGRGIAAYMLSLAFTLVYGMWAAKDHTAGRVLIPILDILQSIPVLGFMPGLIIGMVALFPHSNLGVELAAIIMIFTGQAWNMTFSFYHSVRTIPVELQEVATVYRFSLFERFRWVELPSTTMGLVWNSMVSMAGGWFFLMICESFVLGDRDYRLPGLGSYMSVAVAKGDTTAMVWAIIAMVIMIIALDQLFWRPVVVWAQVFRVEETGQKEEMSSWFLDILRKSNIVEWVEGGIHRVMKFSLPKIKRPVEPTPVVKMVRGYMRFAPTLAFIILLFLLGWGAWKLALFVTKVPLQDWTDIFLAAGLTLSRVMAAIALGTLWALPCGIAIGISPKLSRMLQPIVQVAASFPAPMLFPAAIAVMMALDIPLGWGSIFLMLLGTQWYILFNIIAGAMAVPADLQEAARSYKLTTFQKYKKLYVPAAFPYLVTGWITAAGGAWNASIVAEYVTYKQKTVSAFGLGSQISISAEHADFPRLAASVLVMSAIVVLLNRVLWQNLFNFAKQRYSLNR
jgi:NitT/TauT family transport system permease protein